MKPIAKPTGIRCSFASDDLRKAALLLNSLGPYDAPPVGWDEARRIFAYDPETGTLLRDGAPAGTIIRGQRIVAVSGARVPAHALAFFISTGIWANVTPVDGDFLNLRRENLRQTSEELPWTIETEGEFIARARNDAGVQVTFGRFRSREEAGAAAAAGVFLMRLRGERTY